MAEHVAQDRVLPTDIDGGEIETPHDDILSVGRDAWTDIDVQGLGLAGECVAGDVVDDPWYEGALVVAVGGSCRSGACGIRRGRAGVAENTSSVEVVGAVAGSFGFGAEPVVSDCLVGVDNYVVALACKKSVYMT